MYVALTEPTRSLTSRSRGIDLLDSVIIGSTGRADRLRVRVSHYPSAPRIVAWEANSRIRLSTDPLRSVLVSHSTRFSRASRVRTRVVSVSVAAFVLSIFGCGGGGDGGSVAPQCTVSAVSVTPNPMSVVAGATSALTAAVTQSNCTNLVTTWTTSNAAVATVSSTGIVTGVAAGGPITITASAGGVNGTAQVTVTAAPVPIASISLSQTSGGLAIGQTLQLTATPRDASSNALAGRTITWTSSNNAVATVTATGLVVGVASGQSTITAAAEGRSATALITVSSQPVVSISVTPNGATLQPGATLPLAALTRDGSGNVLSGRTVTWTTGNALIATVSTAGLVTAVGAGAVTITATSEGVSGTAIIVTAGPSGNRFALALASQQSSGSYTPSAADQSTSAGGSIGVTRQSDGVYDVLFPNMTKGAGQREIVQVSSTGGGNVSCQIGSWNPGAGGTVARVYCFSPNGLPADGQYTRLLAESGTLAGRFGFVWADQQTADTYNPNPNWSDNSSGGAIVVTRAGVGNYAVRWAGLARTAGQLDETVIVGAYGNLPRRCNVVSWDAFGTADLTASVSCADVNGVPADSRFVAAVVERGRSTRRYGLTWANQPTNPIYATTSNGYTRTSTVGAVSISRTAVGSYQVRLGGQARTGASPETVLVTAYGSTSYCRASQWAANGADMLVTVLCFDPSGAPIDSRFTVFLVE